MKKKLGLFLALVMIFQVVITLSACGKSEPVSIVVSSTNNKYTIVNDTITVEWGEIVRLSHEDFNIVVNYKNGESETISSVDVDKKGYTFSTDLPVADTVTPIGQYRITFTYQEVTSEVTLNIVEKVVTLEDFVWTDSSNFVYDGTEKQVVITSELPSYVDVTYSNNKNTSARTYIAVANFVSNDPNYALATQTAEHSWTINKADIGTDITSAIRLVNNQLIYNGTEQTVTINSNTIPNGFAFQIISGDKGTNAGEYTLTVKITSLTSDYNDTQITLNWSISKANLSTDGIGLDNTEFVYDGQEKQVNLVGELPLGVTAQIVSGNVGTDVGIYRVIVAFVVNDNYNTPENITLTWEIKNPPAQYTVEPQKVEGIVYDNTEHGIITQGETNEGTVMYRLVSVNGVEVPMTEESYTEVLPFAKDAGTYVVAYKITGDINHSDSEEKFVTTVIEKAVIDVSGVALAQTTFDYICQDIVVSLLRETIPENVVATIVSGGTAKNAGNYKATVGFDYDESNYDLSGNVVLDYTVNKADLVITAVIDNEIVIGGELNPSYTATGFVGEDTVSVIKGEPVYNYGDYNPKTATEGNVYTLTVSGLYADNYNVSFNETKYTVTRPGVEVTDLAGNKTYIKTMPAEITESSTYKLLMNCTIESLVIGTDKAIKVTIDLNNFVLYHQSEYVDSMITFADNSTDNEVVLSKGMIFGSDNCAKIITITEGNTVTLSDDLEINSSRTGVVLSGDNAVLNTEADIIVNNNDTYYAIFVRETLTGTVVNISGGTITSSTTAICSVSNGVINITSGTINADTVIDTRICDISISGGNFNGILSTFDNHKFITGGIFNYDFSEEDFVAQYYEISDLYNGYYEVVSMPEITSIYFYSDIYNVNFDKNFINTFSIELYDNRDRNTIRQLNSFGDELTIEGLEDINTPGEHTIKFIYHNINGKDVSLTTYVTTVAIVDIEVPCVYVKNASSPYNFNIKIIYSNGNYDSRMLNQVVDMSTFSDSEFVAGETYDINASFAGFSKTITLVVDEIAVEYIEFRTPRQYLGYSKVDTSFNVKYNCDISAVMYDFNSSALQLVSIVDQNGNIVNDVKDITETGIYTFTIKVGLVTSPHGYSTYTDGIEVKLEIVSGDTVSDFNLDTPDIIVGEKPLFTINKFSGEYNEKVDILEESIYSQEEFDYMTEGNYTFTMTYEGVTKEFTIKVHSPSEVKSVYMYDSTYVIGYTRRLRMRVETYDGQQSYVDFDTSYLVEGTGEIDFTQKGYYNAYAEYQGVRFYVYISVYNQNDVNYMNIYNYENYFPVGTDAILLEVHYYNNTSALVPLTNDMIISGEFDINTPGTYYFGVKYNGYESNYNITIYDPSNIVVNGIYLKYNRYFVWTYTQDNDNIIINNSVDGLYISVYYSDGKTEDIPVTLEMISYDEKTLLANIDKATIEVTITYGGQTETFHVTFINQDNINDMAQLCKVEVIKNGTSEDMIITEINTDIEGYYLSFTNDGYSYIIPLTQDMIVDNEKNLIGNDKVGAYYTYLFDERFKYVVYSDEEISKYFYLRNSFDVLQGTTAEEIIAQLVGKQLGYTKYISDLYLPDGESIYYSINEYITITREMIVSVGDASEFGYIDIAITYNGFTDDFSLDVIPDVSGEEGTYFLYISNDSDDIVCLYNNYINFGHSSWYAYELYDEELSIYKLTSSYGGENYYVIDHENLIIRRFKAEDIFETEPVIYSGSRMGEYYVLHIYNSRYIDAYRYNDKGELVYDGTIVCEFYEEEGQTIIVIEGQKYTVGEDNVLIISVTGDILYTFEMEDKYEFILMEFRIDKGVRTAYYYTKTTEEGDYMLEVTLDWEINEEETLIKGYYMGFNVLDFEITDGVITGVIQKTN